MSIRDSISNEVEREHWIALVNGNSHTKQCIPVGQYKSNYSHKKWYHDTEGNWSIDINKDGKRVIFTHCDHKTGIVYEWHFDDLHNNIVNDYQGFMW